MRKIVLIAGLLTGWLASASGQNYVSGIVSMYGTNMASGTTTVAPGASFYFNKNTFYEQAGFINLGDSVAISADSGTLALSGSTLQTLSGRFKISALQLLNAAGAGINNTVPVTMVTILDSVSFSNISNASFNAGDSLLTLRSNALKTARIADLTNNGTNSGNAINGKVIAERYVRSRRAWHLLGPPTTADSANNQTIKTAWQEGATAARGQMVDPKPGYGTVITRPGNNPSAATGYDDGVYGSTIYSLYTYSSNGFRTYPPNTDLTKFSAHASYLLFVRGDRSVGPATQTTTNHTPPTITTLRSKGSVHNGSVTDTITTASDNFAGVANPYACTVDFSKANLNGIVNGFYVWDPSLATIGAWVYIDGDDNYRATPSGVGAYTNPAQNSLLQSGEGILVRSISNQGYLTFQESNKNITSRSDVFRETPLPSLNISLYSNDSDNVFLDGTTSVFDASFTKSALPEEDIYKPSNLTENLSFFASSITLMKNKTPQPVANDTLFMKLWNTSAKKYRFLVTTDQLTTSSQPYLLDRYLQTTSPISAGSNTNYNFEINADAASKSADRFAIVFGATTLPVTLTQIKADAINGGVDVQWTVENETGIANYEVEKSLDGRTFNKIGTVAATNGNLAGNTYHLFDALPANGINYYRVKSIGITGKYSYTNIAEATIAVGKATITLVANPVRNEVVKILFTREEAGKYNLILFANDGKRITAKTIEHIGGTATYSLPAGKLAKGVYLLQVIGGDTNNKKSVSLRAIIE